MSLENVANEDLLVSFSNSAGPPDIVYLGDQPIDAIKIVPVKSVKCKANGKSICTTSIAINFAIATGGCPHTSATHTFVAGAASIAPSAIKTKAEGALVLREGDVSVIGCIGTWTNNSTSAVVPCACSANIASAGQNKVKAQ